MPSQMLRECVGIKWREIIWVLFISFWHIPFNPRVLCCFTYLEEYLCFLHFNSFAATDLLTQSLSSIVFREAYYRRIFPGFPSCRKMGRGTDFWMMDRYHWLNMNRWIQLLPDRRGGQPESSLPPPTWGGTPSPLLAPGRVTSSRQLFGVCPVLLGRRCYMERVVFNRTIWVRASTPSFTLEVLVTGALSAATFAGGVGGMDHGEWRWRRTCTSSPLNTSQRGYADTEGDIGYAP